MFNPTQPNSTRKLRNPTQPNPCTVDPNPMELKKNQSDSTQQFQCKPTQPNPTQLNLIKSLRRSSNHWNSIQAIRVIYRNKTKLKQTQTDSTVSNQQTVTWLNPNQLN